MLFKPKTIAEQGGLETYLTKQGFDFQLFLLLDKANIPNPQIAHVLNVQRGRGREPDRGTIRRWRGEYKKETSDTIN